ncbi:triple tyrosine motif-containing protein [Mucilaginibacter lacusdianchii]|uniref:triple tyrosine motif-containing protein n=1 Tax=Mucilaginibacter lacusdianchii TaxID=2684211 RepID=UPI00131EC944|nr:triple tyrosine motif-containing protein [Mucilaginibacter sp. JXJ CY 39]
MKRIAIVLLFILLAKLSFGQRQIGTPLIFNYKAEQYKGGVQNWDVAQDKRGLLYFGNKEGLLSFNGKFWSHYALPNYTVVRSVKVDEQNRVFVGGQDELGYFFPDEVGVLKYHSLLSKLPPNERKMADIWNIAVNKDGAFFRSWGSIIHFDDGAVNVYKPDVSWDFLGCVNNKILAQSRNKGLLAFDKGTWVPFADDSVLRNTAISFVLPYHKDTIIAGTLKKGLFLIAGGKLIKQKTGIDQMLADSRLVSGVRLNNGGIAIGTLGAGLVIIDKRWQIVQQYAGAEGLQSESVHAVFNDENGSLWLAQDNGLDMIAINSAVRYIYPDKSNPITYSMRVYDHKLYMGTSNGLFYTPLDVAQKDLALSKGTFKKVKNTDGQVWNLGQLNNHLVIGHEDGLYEIINDEGRQLYAQPGTWLFQPVSNIYPSARILAGTYNGLQLIGDTDGKLLNLSTVKGIDESLRFFVYDHSRNTVWASHPYHGVYKLELSVDMTQVVKKGLYTQKQGLPSTLYNYVYHVHNRTVVATHNGIYEYDESAGTFKFSSFFEPYFHHIPVIYLKEDNDGNIWFVTDRKEVGVVEMRDEKKGQVTYFPEIKGKIVGGFESIYPYNSQNIFIGSTRGIVQINYKRFKENTRKLDVVLGKVSVIGEKEKLIYGGYFLKDGKVSQIQASQTVPQLKYDENYLHFEFASTLYNEQNTIEYSCYLEGLDRGWSAWSGKSDRDYTALPAGTYTFKIKARSHTGNESNVIAYTFIIAPVWYKSMWSYVLYIGLIVLAIYWLLRWQRKQHIKEKEKLQYLNQLELDKNEREIIRLQNEKLESEIDYKNRELANMVMHLVQRGKVIDKIKEELSTMLGKNEGASNSTHFKRLLRLINEVEKGEKDWEQFNQHFNTVHAHFFKKLQSSFPDITLNELKLCAYTKMNLSTKEIAQMMNITVKAVEIARYRLRKKLMLQPDTNLYAFLGRFEEASSHAEV